MKRNLFVSILIIFSSIFISWTATFAEINLYDDFSETYIDAQKWKDREFVREVSAGKLISKIGNTAGTGGINNTAFQNPQSITSIECRLTMVATALDTGTNPESFAKIGGFFYNTKGSGGATGDVWAAVYIGNRGSGLEAYWEIQESLDGDLKNLEDKGTGTLIAPGTLTYGTAYNVKISYNGSNGFIFTVDGQSNNFSGPARKRAEVTEFKGLITGIDADGGSGIGYASALFDDVYINNEATIYDNFFSAYIDPTKWQHLEFAREIANGKLRLSVQPDGYRKTAKIRPNDQAASYLQARFLIKNDSQLSSGARAKARIAGYYYNANRGDSSGLPYNGYEGDIWVENKIYLDDSSNLKAKCSLWRTDGPDSLGPGTSIFHHKFSIPIAFNTEYTLSIGLSDSTFTFKCNDETYLHKVNAPMYEPSNGQYREFAARVYTDPGESGHMKVQLDDVYAGTVSVPVYKGATSGRVTTSGGDKI